MNEKLIQELKAWVTFYKNGSIAARTEKDCTFNSGIVDGVKMTLDMLVKYKMITKEDVNKIF